MFVQLPYVSIKPNYFTTYIHRDVTGDHHTYKREFAPLPTDTRHHGLMSNKANGRVRLAIDWMLYLAKDKELPQNKSTSNFRFKVNFITLTLASRQRHSDNTIKSELLNQFLTELRTKYKCKHYLWRAEAQSNGNIHFHIVTDVFVPWRTLRTDWNRIQNKLGYVDAFTERTGKFDPNGTDVHSVVRINDLAAYLSKYCSKNSKGYTVLVTKASKEPFKPALWLNYKWSPYRPLSTNKKTGRIEKAKFFRQISGRLWGLSQSLSKFKTAKREVAGLLERECEWLRNKFKDKIRYTKQACMYFFSQAELIKMNCLTLAGTFNAYIDSVLNPPPIEPPKPSYIPIPLPVLPRFIQGALSL